MFKTLCIVVPNQDYLNQAGARIRYKRLAKYYEENNYLLCFSELNDCLRDDCDSHDVYLISKCYSSSAVVLAQKAKDAGKLVGVDLFDDYFSQSNDSRFVRLRNWLRNLARICDFAWSSTERMKSVAIKYFAPDKVHVLNDPIDANEFLGFDQLLSQKHSHFLETNTLDIVWFGMGDNPDFRVGLSDLLAFKEQLLFLNRQSFRVKITILTNLRALTPQMMQRLRSIGSSLSIELWTEEREKETLRKAFACFIPVNYQGFSIVKSLNRCVTAFTYGCQVIAPGFNLYSDLEQFYYRDIREFVLDLQNKSLKYQANELGDFKSTLLNKADPAIEARNSSLFLNSLVETQLSSSESIELDRSNNTSTVDSERFKGFIFGLSIPIEQVALIQQSKYITISSPFSVSKIRPSFRFDYDVQTGRFRFFVRSNFLDSFEEISFREIKTLGEESIGKASYTEVCMFDIESEICDMYAWIIKGFRKKLSDPSFLLLHYKDVIEVIGIVLNYFLNIDLYLLEESKLPWRQPNLQMRDVV